MFIYFLDWFEIGDKSPKCVLTNNNDIKGQKDILNTVKLEKKTLVSLKNCLQNKR